MTTTQNIRNLYSSIILMAIDDWHKRPRLREEIREFLRSDWGKECCDVVDLSATDILDRLENNKIDKSVLRCLEEE